jgi:hypothetical protein
LPANLNQWYDKSNSNKDNLFLNFPTSTYQFENWGCFDTSLVLINPTNTSGSFTGSEWHPNLKGCIAIAPSVYAKTSINNSLLLGSCRINIAADAGSGAWPQDLYYSIIAGANNRVITYSNPGYYKFLLGNGLKYLATSQSDAQKSVAIVGEWNTPTDAVYNKFVVGAGSSDSSRANCFATGKDSNNEYYIMVGSTKITEAQLQALLATL